MRWVEQAACMGEETYRILKGKSEGWRFVWKTKAWI
jgi:hypothetical protein